MNYYDLASLRLLGREHHAQRLREAEAERLARQFRRTPQRRGRLRLRIALPLGDSAAHVPDGSRPRATCAAEPQRVAVHLGFNEPTIQRLRARGYLSRLALTEPQIRARLYHAHLAHLHRHVSGQPEKERT